MRPGQHNKRGRSRNRRHSSSSSSGSSGGGGGGNPLSRIYESNGPDVKVRGSAQTVAEKYLQLGRDAQASGDIVMAESYYQYAEHYLRIVAAAQAYQQQMQPQFRRPGEEFDDDGDEEGVEGDGEEGQAPAEAAIPPGLSDQPDASATQVSPEGERQQQNFRPREQQSSRDRFRPRWQDKRERQPFGDQPREASLQPRPDEQQRNAEAGNGSGGEAQANAQWEAPSFLRRPAALPGAEAGEEQPQRRPRYERRPRREGEASDETTVPETPPPVD
jgi:uncharacterized protein DUF4167